MKVYDEGNCLFGTLTLDDLGMTKSQDQKCQISLFAFIMTFNHLNIQVLYIKLKLMAKGSAFFGTLPKMTLA